MKIYTFICIFVMLMLINGAVAIQDTPLGMAKDPEPQNETKTNVSVIKIVDGTEGYPRLVYNIKTPRVDDFEFVLAIDSSGSMGFGSGLKKLQERAVIGAVPDFVEGIPDMFSQKNFKMSIVSWDDDIDFAYKYGDFNNIDPAKAELIDVDKVAGDLENNSVFGENSDTTYYYSCDELDKTDFSEAIGSSISILDSNNKTDFHRTKRFIILVTGGGEFTECDEELIDAAERSHYPIYVIGMDVYKDTRLFKHLERLGGYDPNRIEFIPPTPETLEKNLKNALDHALNNATIAPVAYNVTISETFYSYFIPEIDSIVVKGDSFDSSGNPIKYKNISPNEDGTYTITFQLANGLLPECETEISFDTALSLKEMPITVTKPPSPIPIHEISEMTPVSSFKYVWFNGDPFTLELKDVPINIETSRLRPMQGSNMGSSIGETTPSTGSTSTRMPIGEHFGLISLIGFAVLFMILKREG